jgi:hypothetical protein
MKHFALQRCLLHNVARLQITLTEILHAFPPSLHVGAIIVTSNRKASVPPKFFEDHQI